MLFKSIKYAFLRRYVAFKISFMRMLSIGENSAPVQGVKAIIASIAFLFAAVLRFLSKIIITIFMVFAGWISSFKAGGLHETLEYFETIWERLKSPYIHGRRQRLMPISMLCAVGIMIFSLSYFGVGVEVFVDGESYGFVNSREEVLSIIHEVENETAEYLGRPYNMQADITYSFAYIQRDKMIDPDDFKAMLFSGVNEISVKYVLLLDGEIVGAHSSKTALELLKQKIFEAKSPDVEDMETSFVQDITIEERHVANSYIKTIAEIEEDLMADTREVKMHSVKKGDTFSKIAQQYGISTQALKSLNPDVEDTSIQIGAQIRVAAAVPVLSVKSTRTVKYTETLPYDVSVEYSESMYKNQSKIKQKGAVGQEEITADVVYIDGEEVERVELSRVLMKAPVDEIKVMGTKALPAKAATGSLRWPISGTITSRYGYRWGGEFHTGIDIAKASGSPIVAADGGTVILSKYNGNYGYCVIIDHGNGLKTLYAHTSKLLVSKGQKVAKGERIALVGSTGRSTGPHLHFEVQKNGKTVNPISYLP